MKASDVDCAETVQIGARYARIKRSTICSCCEPCMFHYGYFVICQNGRLAPAGDDWGPTRDTYKPGAVLGTRNGVKAIVIDVIKGQEAVLNNVDVMILVKEQRTEGVRTMEWIKHIAHRMAAARPRRLTSWPQIQTEFHGQKLRAVRNKMYARPKEETFQDFLINHLLWFLGEEWFNKEMRKPPEQRHIILRWRHERSEQLLKNDSPNRDTSVPLKAPMTGGAKALLVLADDVLQLAQALDTPSRVSERLGDMHEFQGARYEILVASLFARCGFQIGFIDDATKRNPEFIASKGSERIAVEAKSRHRAGVLHERGAFADEAPAEIKRLYESAEGNFERPSHLFQGLDGRNGMPVLNARNVASKQTRALFDIPLRKPFLFAYCT